MAVTKLSEARFYQLKGYYNLLETAPPNGRLVHDIKQKMTVLAICIQAGFDVESRHEEEIKDMIRDLYSSVQVVF
jgi:hypothetical protein